MKYFKMTYVKSEPLNLIEEEGQNKEAESKLREQALIQV